MGIRVVTRQQLADALHQKIEEISIRLNSKPEADGKLHRCGTIAKPTGTDGAYIIHLDPPASAWFMNWQTGESTTWTDRSSQRLTQAQRQTLQERIKADRKERLKEERRRHADAARASADRLKRSQDCTAHPYLERKCVRPVAGLKLDSSGQLVVPVLNRSGQAQSLQFIAPDGTKRFLTGGRTSEGHFPIPGADGPLYIAEGLATGLSIHEATGMTVWCAFNCGNLLKVAVMARERFSDREIVLCADDDRKTNGNPGLTAATASAAKVNGQVAKPVFPDDIAGTDFNDLAVAVGLEEVRRQLHRAASPQGKEPRLGLPPGYVLRKNGVYFLEERQGGIEEHFVCSPLKVQAITRDDSGKGWGRLLELVNADGESVQWAMPMSMLAANGDEYRRVLLDLGLTIAPAQKGKNRLETYLNSCRPEARARCVGRIGWHGRRFVLPDEIIGDGDEALVLQTANTSHDFHVRGSLEDWQREIGTVCAGNPLFAFAVAAALAAPLIHLAEAESGGFHFVGMSSSGKTTALELAGSVCGGGGIRGYVSQWRATANGLEALAASRCDTLLCLDELSQINAKDASETGYLLANGIGKARAKRDGEGRKPAEWRLLFLSSGEITLADKIRENGHGRAAAGQAVRVADIPADAGGGMGAVLQTHGFPDSRALIGHIKDAVRRHYGTPLRAFLKLLTDDLENARGYLNKYLAYFVQTVCPEGADGQVRRVCARFALVAAAGELAVSYGVLPWTECEAQAMTEACFQSWLRFRGGTGSGEVMTGVSLVRAFIQKHGNSRFQAWGDRSHEDRIADRAGFRRQDGNGNWEYYVFPEVFRSEICQGLNAEAVLRELDRLGLLKRGESDKFTVKPRIPGHGNGSRFYLLLPEILGEGSTERTVLDFKAPPTLQVDSPVGHDQAVNL